MGRVIAELPQEDRPPQKAAIYSSRIDSFGSLLLKSFF